MLAITAKDRLETREENKYGENIAKWSTVFLPLKNNNPLTSNEGKIFNPWDSHNHTTVKCKNFGSVINLYPLPEQLLLAMPYSSIYELSIHLDINLLDSANNLFCKILFVCPLPISQEIPVARRKNNNTNSQTVADFMMIIYCYTL